MDTKLDFFDIQGNILKNYSEAGFIKARYLFFHIKNGNQGRTFLSNIQHMITSCAPWNIANGQSDGVNWPDATTNISFTYNGLKTLGLSVQTLQSFPEEFIIGMRGRRTILGDNGASDPEFWDPVFHQEIHMFVSIEAQTQAALVERYNEILTLIAQHELHEVILLDGHRAEKGMPHKKYQDASAIYEHGLPTAKEHFGYTDGISNPFIKGMTQDMGYLTGGGKKNTKAKLGYGDPANESTWLPLETGEFILGYQDEAQEYPMAPMPPLMGRNGSFLVYRKLHENVGKFHTYLDTAAKSYPGSKEQLAAKFVGRWRNGVPLTSYPVEADANALALKLQTAMAAIITAPDTQGKIEAEKEYRIIYKEFHAFDYNKDMSGGGCPVGAHVRRTNPRGSLEFGHEKAFDSPSAVDNRRRIIRRGLPYGDSADDKTSNTGNHGTIFMTINASIKRQFEFVLQQWVNYGNDFKLANDKDPILGNHDEREGVGNGRMVLQATSETDAPPHFLSEMPRFLETRGGEYFFIPSLTALRMIAEKIVDPT